MRILWVVNLMLPEIAGELNLPSSNREGWLSGIFGMMASSNEYELCVAYPVTEEVVQNPVSVRGIKCYAFMENLGSPEDYDASLEDKIEKIIEEVNPDVLHIFGTEFPHGLAAARAFGKPEKTLVGLQGICAEIAREYMALIPEKVQNEVTFRDFIRKDSLKKQQEKFFKRSENEQKLLGSVSYVTGRTEFDRNYALGVNDKLMYMPLHENMRDEFYEEVPSAIDKRPHSIFLMQGDYPIKGFHFLIEACGKLKEKYQDLAIFVAGNSIIRHSTFKEKLKTPAYGKYLRKLIKENHLEGSVFSLGSLNASEVRKQYLGSSVFVCPSYMDNSPNAIAEAMLLGVPVVASDAGGIRSILSEEEGYIFHKGNSGELEECLDKVFTLIDTQDEELTRKIKNASKRAREDYDKGTNYRTLIEIYKKIAE